jgi:hypothetical protein
LKTDRTTKIETWVVEATALPCFLLLVPISIRNQLENRCTRVAAVAAAFGENPQSPFRMKKISQQYLEINLNGPAISQGFFIHDRHTRLLAANLINFVHPS